VDSNSPPAPPQLEPAAAERRFGWLVLAFALTYLAVVGLQQGDFWPFSRFGMFSNPGKVWKRALLRQVPEGVELREVAADKLPGMPFALGTLGIDQNDLSATVQSLHSPLLPAEQALLAAYFRNLSQPLVLYRVDGRLRSKDHSLRVRYLPLARVGPAGVQSIQLAPGEAR
jgi:hypothetical protein